MSVDLVAGPATVDLGGTVVDTMAFGDTVPGAPIRIRAGDELTVNLKNGLQDPTLVHWHGLAIRNDMDGVPGLTQNPIEPGGEFTYRFVVPDAGTHWFHPHMGLGLDTGLYAAIIVEDPDEPGDYDAEEILIFDDWIDGIDGGSPEKVLADLLAAGPMDHSMEGMTDSDMSGMDHSNMSDGDMSEMDHSNMSDSDTTDGDMSGMDHSNMSDGDMSDMDHSNMSDGDMSEMDHSNMTDEDMSEMDHSNMSDSEMSDGDMSDMDHSNMSDSDTGDGNASSADTASTPSAAAKGGGMTMSPYGDVEYPLHVVNGRAPSDPITIGAAPGARIRLRMINAAADTVYRIAIGDHPLMVTHLDGYPITPVEVDTVMLSMGERIDAIVTVGDGASPIVAAAEGKSGSAFAVLRSTGSTAATPSPTATLSEHKGRLLDVTAAVADQSVAYPSGEPDRQVELVLGEDTTAYRWTINGATYGNDDPVTVEEGERVRLVFRNDTMMVHPMHLHGHTFALATPGGARKDTLLVPVMGTLAVDVIADNPGQWMLHCHNLYHQETGMATTLSYVT